MTLLDWLIFDTIAILQCQIWARFSPTYTPSDNYSTIVRRILILIIYMSARLSHHPFILKRLESPCWPHLLKNLRSLFIILIVIIFLTCWYKLIHDLVITNFVMRLLWHMNVIYIFNTVSLLFSLILIDKLFEIL